MLMSKLAPDDRGAFFSKHDGLNLSMPGYALARRPYFGQAHVPEDLRTGQRGYPPPPPSQPAPMPALIDPSFYDGLFRYCATGCVANGHSAGPEVNYCIARCFGDNQYTPPSSL